MSDPVERFCKMIEALDNDHAKGILQVPCMILGCPTRETGVPMSRAKELSDLVVPEITNDLRLRLKILVDRADVWPEVIISGRLHYLARFYEHLADPRETSALIDDFLARQDFLHAELAKPVGHRKQSLSAEKLGRLISLNEMLVTNRLNRREERERIASLVREEWGQEFPDGYWQEWTMQHLREIRPPELGPSLFEE